VLKGIITLLLGAPGTGTDAVPIELKIRLIEREQAEVCHDM
jgi:hypothetical protein